MSDEVEFKTVFSTTLVGDGDFSASFPVPEHLKPLVLSQKNNERAIEYYLLARYAFFHKMHSAYMVNAFWSVEHLILALLCLKYNDKDSLRDLGGFHSLTGYWREAKELVGEEKASTMSKFDDYIGKVKGYFQERYPTTEENGKLQYTSKKARVVLGENPDAKAAKFGKSYKLELDELDHFVNFMIHDITSFGNDVSLYYMDFLDSHNNAELYLEKNQFSIIHPNKVYHGENK